MNARFDLEKAKKGLNDLKSKVFDTTRAEQFCSRTS